MSRLLFVLSCASVTCATSHQALCASCSSQLCLGQCLHQSFKMRWRRKRKENTLRKLTVVSQKSLDDDNREWRRRKTKKPSGFTKPKAQFLLPALLVGVQDCNQTCRQMHTHHGTLKFNWTTVDAGILDLSSPFSTYFNSVLRSSARHFSTRSKASSSVIMFSMAERMNLICLRSLSQRELRESWLAPDVRMSLTPT